jgi:hypothetical protein
MECLHIHSVEIDTNRNQPGCRHCHGPQIQRYGRRPFGYRCAVPGPRCGLHVGWRVLFPTIGRRSPVRQALERPAPVSHRARFCVPAQRWRTRPGIHPPSGAGAGVREIAASSACRDSDMHASTDAGSSWLPHFRAPRSQRHVTRSMEDLASDGESPCRFLLERVRHFGLGRPLRKWR